MLIFCRKNVSLYFLDGSKGIVVRFKINENYCKKCLYSALPDDFRKDLYWFFIKNTFFALFWGTNGKLSESKIGLMYSENENLL